jgi:hypothetical protein
MQYPWKRGNVCSVLLGKPEGKIPLGRPRHWWGDNFIIDLKEVRWEGVIWIYLACDRDWWKAFVNSIGTFGFHVM